MRAYYHIIYLYVVFITVRNNNIHEMHRSGTHVRIYLWFRVCVRFNAIYRNIRFIGFASAHTYYMY